MIKLLCPNCMKSVAVPDDAGGTTAPCPECGTPFDIPARYNPVVAPAPAPVVPPAPPVPVPVPPEPPPMSFAPPPPPGLVPPTSTQMEPPLPPTPPVPPVPAGYTHSRGVTISPRVMAWVPAACLSLIFVLTFFTWIGSYVGGHPVYAQNAWRALGGTVSRNFHLEGLMKQQAAWPTELLNKVTSDWMLLPYVLALVLALAFAWAERMVASLDRARLPRSFQWVAAVWPYRIPVTAGLATVALLLVVVQTVSGFGLERAMKQAVSEKFAEERKQSAANPAALDALEFRADQELAKYNLERTSWLYLAVFLHVVVVLAMVVRAGLERRGNMPPPRVVIQY